jgi:hypothetical protein
MLAVCIIVHSHDVCLVYYCILYVSHVYYCTLDVSRVYYCTLTWCFPCVLLYTHMMFALCIIVHSHDVCRVYNCTLTWCLPCVWRWPVFVHGAWRSRKHTLLSPSTFLMLLFSSSLWHHSHSVNNIIIYMYLTSDTTHYVQNINSICHQSARNTFETAEPLGQWKSKMHWPQPLFTGPIHKWSKNYNVNSQCKIIFIYTLLIIIDHNVVSAHTHK